MSDIVERLRGQVAMSVYASSGSMWAEMQDQRQKAADEIDRLRADLDVEKRAAINLSGYLSQAHAEINTLRAELSRYRAWHDAVMAQGSWYSDCAYECVQVIVRPQPLEVKQ